MLSRLLVRVAGASWKHPWVVLGLTLALTAVSAFSLRDLSIDATFMGILDSDDPEAQRLMELSSDFGAASGLVLVIKDGTEAERQQAALAAVDALLPLDVVVDARARLESDLALEFGILYLDDPQFRELEGSVRRLHPVLLALTQDQTLEAGLGALRAEMLGAFAGTGPPPTQDGLRSVIGLLDLIEQGAQSPLTRDQVDDLLFAGVAADPNLELGGYPLRDGWLASADGGVYLVDVRTTLDPMRMDMGMEDFGAVEDALAQVRADHPDQWIHFSGLLPGGYEDQKNVLGKVLPLSSLSLVLVLAALLLLDRRPLTPLLVGAGLIVSVIWTFALVKLVFGYASLTSTAFGILLFGLGVDYAVHVVVRFNDERAAGLEGQDAIRVALSKTGRGVVVGGLTSMTAFALMVLTDFKAASHLGITAAMGLGCALIIMVGVLPAALAVTDRGGRPRRSLELPALDRLVRGCLERPQVVLGGVVVVVVACGLQLPRFQVETDLEKLITQDLPAIEANHVVAEAFGGSAEAVFSTSTSLEQARDRADAFQALDSVARVDGVHAFIPVEVDHRLDRNRRLQPLLVGLDLEPGQPRDHVDETAIITELDAIAGLGARVAAEARFGGHPELAAQGMELRQAALDASAAVQGNGGTLAISEAAMLGSAEHLTSGLRQASSLWSFGPEDLPPEVQDRYVRDGVLLSYVFPSDYRISYDFLTVFKAEVKGVDPDAVGTLFVVDKLVVGGMDRLPIAVGAILVALLGILWWDLRDIRRVLVALVPLVLGSTVALGIILALGMPISILMMSAFPLVFGIGIDDGVHILHRWEEGEQDVAKAIASTGKAILFTSVTTSLGFSILFLLNHRGLAGMAALVLLGVATCFVTSVTVLPVLAQRLARRT